MCVCRLLQGKTIGRGFSLSYKKKEGRGGVENARGKNGRVAKEGPHNYFRSGRVFLLCSFKENDY